MQNIILPRLIRPERDGKQGEWSYLFHAQGHDYIFPAVVNELGELKGLLGKDDAEAPTLEVMNTEGGLCLTKVIYWKASEWPKYHALAIDWVKRFGWRMPDLPYDCMELRKIEDRGGEDRVSEVINVVAFPDYRGVPTIYVHQFKGIDGEEGKGHRPLMQWTMESTIEFRNGTIEGSGVALSNAGKSLTRWSKHPVIIKDMIEKQGRRHALKVLCVNDKEIKIIDDEVRVATIWLAFCLYINSLKPEGKAVEPTGRKNRSTGRSLEEVVALEQATVLKSAGILKSGVRRQTIATGTGTKHRYRYLVRGHERVINGQAIWIKPQIRGDGEFMVLPTATSPELVAAIPETPVRINVAVREPTSPPLGLPPPRMLLLPAPRRPVEPRKPPVRVGLVAALWALLRTMFA